MLELHMLFLNFFLFFSITIFLFIKYNQALSFKFRLLDIPNERKKHKSPTPLSGGFLFLILFLESILIINFYKIEEINLSVILFSILIFFIGLIDDINDLNAKFKLFILTFLILIFLHFQPFFQIDLINSVLISKKINLEYSKVFFTTLCILLLINAFNMSDGINGLLIGYAIIAFLYLNQSYGNQNFNLIIILIILIICFIFNLLNKFFLGDSGVFLISFLLSIELITSYKSELSNIKEIEEIFLILMIPGLDMFRLFCYRIINKKNPFKADNNHLHHILSNKLSKGYVLIICLSLSFLPIFIFKIIISNILIPILIGSVLYCLTIFLFVKKIHFYHEK